MKENSAGNGWDVRVSFRNAPAAFGRAAHVWTLDRAKEVADQLLQEHANVSEDLSVAAIRIEGKDGTGEVRADQGPHLPDWPIVEQQFRARTRLKSAELDNKLLEVKDAWEQVATAAEEVLRSREKPVTSEKAKALKKLQASYNAKAQELDDAFFGNHEGPLPRLRLPDPQHVYEHARDWAITKSIQHESEGLTKEIRMPADFDSEVNRNSDGKADKTKVEFDDTQPKAKPGDALKDSDKRKSPDGGAAKTLPPQSKADELDRIMGMVDAQLKAVDNLLVDSSRIAPPADGFSAEPGTAIYTSMPRVEVRKLDANGNDMTDNQQPAGYPKPFLAGLTIGAGEGVRLRWLSQLFSPKRPTVIH